MWAPWSTSRGSSIPFTSAFLTLNPIIWIQMMRSMPCWPICFLQMEGIPSKVRTLKMNMMLGKLYRISKNSRAAAVCYKECLRYGITNDLFSRIFSSAATAYGSFPGPCAAGCPLLKFYLNFDAETYKFLFAHFLIQVLLLSPVMLWRNNMTRLCDILMFLCQAMSICFRSYYSFGRNGALFKGVFIIIFTSKCIFPLLNLLK